MSKEIIQIFDDLLEGGIKQKYAYVENNGIIEVVRVNYVDKTDEEALKELYEKIETL